MSNDKDFIRECKAAYLAIVDDIKEDLSSKDELMQALQQTGRNPSVRTIKKYWTDDVCYMSFPTFCDVCRREPVTTKEELIKAFTRIDTNGDGFISVDELRKILTTKEHKISVDEVKDIIRSVDENDDGKLNYCEFTKLVMDTTLEVKRLSLEVMRRKEKKKGISSSSSSSRRSVNNLGSRQSLLTGSRQSLHGSQQSLLSIDDYPSSSKKSSSRPSSGKKGKNHAPPGVQDWTHIVSKGSFYIEEDGIISHHYKLIISKKTTAWITIKPLNVQGPEGADDDNPVDTMLYVLRGKDSSDNLIAWTEDRDSHGKYTVQCELKPGTYRILPYTTGCRFKPRHSEPGSEATLVKGTGSSVKLSTAFKRALGDIFEMCDLDCNGTLSREEFNWFNIRTSGEDVADDEWAVVVDNTKLERGEIPKKGFIALHEMEAADNDGDTDDLWVTLSSMGFNKNLIMDEAAPFVVHVYTESDRDSELIIAGIDDIKEDVENAVCQGVVAKGEGSKIKNGKDLYLHSYKSQNMATYVIENKAWSKVKVNLDCSRSRNVISNHDDLEQTVDVAPHQSTIGMHLMPEDDRSDWSAKCSESVQK